MQFTAVNIHKYCNSHFHEESLEKNSEKYLLEKMSKTLSKKMNCSSLILKNTVRDWNKLPSDVFAKMEVSEHPMRTFAAVVKKKGGS